MPVQNITLYRRLRRNQVIRVRIGESLQFLSLFGCIRAVFGREERFIRFGIAVQPLFRQIQRPHFSVVTVRGKIQITTQNVDIFIGDLLRIKIGTAKVSVLIRPKPRIAQIGGVRMIRNAPTEIALCPRRFKNFIEDIFAFIDLVFVLGGKLRTVRIPCMRQRHQHVRIRVVFFERRIGRAQRANILIHIIADIVRPHVVPYSAHVHFVPDHDVGKETVISVRRIALRQKFARSFPV